MHTVIHLCCKGEDVVLPSWSHCEECTVSLHGIINISVFLTLLKCLQAFPVPAYTLPIRNHVHCVYCQKVRLHYSCLTRRQNIIIQARARRHGQENSTLILCTCVGVSMEGFDPSCNAFRTTDLKTWVVNIPSLDLARAARGCTWRLKKGGERCL